jgi:hypothetical protein
VLHALNEHSAEKFLHFGGESGELTKLLADRFPHAEVSCHETAPNLFEEAKPNLSGLYHPGPRFLAGGTERAEAQVRVLPRSLRASAAPGHGEGHSNAFDVVRKFGSPMRNELVSSEIYWS